MIIVTGHLGFVGQHLMKALAGHDVAGLDIKSGSDILTCDLPDADRVYHLAAQTDAQTENVVEDARTNIMGTLRVLERYGSKVVLASTAMVLHRDVPYGVSKMAAESYALIYGAAVVRFGNLYGDGGHSVVDKFRDSDEIEIRGSGEQLRSYAPVEAAVAALTGATPGHVDVVRGVDMTVNEIASRHPHKPVRRVPRSPYDPMLVAQVNH